MAALPGSRAVTFAITHDIPTNDGFRYQILNPTDEKLAYAYLLGRDGGSPLVYSDHGETQAKDGLRWQDYYLRSDIKGMIRFHNAVQGQPMQLVGSGDCFVLFKRGKQGLVGINKCDYEQEYWLDTAKFEMNWYRNYRDVLDQSAVVNVQSHGSGLPFPPAAPASGCRSKPATAARGRHRAASLFAAHKMVSRGHTSTCAGLFCPRRDALLNKANEAEGASR